MIKETDFIKSILGSYKKGLFGNREEVIIHFYVEHMEGKGLEYYAGDFTKQVFYFEYKNIKSVEIRELKDVKCLVVEYTDVKSNPVFQKENTILMAFPNIEQVGEERDFLVDLVNVAKEKEAIRRQQETKRKEQLLLEKKRRDEECKKYYEDCYDFHITKDNNPFFELKRDGLEFVAIYIDKKKNLNFLSIDGNKKQENNACISYDKLHYYDKAGSIHYISDIKGNYSNFGGSFKGGTISKGVSAIAGLLFGPMGMATGALFSHKPAQAEIPETNFNINTEVQKIDDRSVILNYFSDSKKELVDIELPMDIYNFLQTYLPNKKYGIVLEIEKKQAVEATEAMAIETREEKYIACEDDMQSFERKIKKLILMKENGLLTDEEFANEKQRILNNL